MRSRKKIAGFRIRKIVARDHGVSYQTFQVVGYLNGERVRKKFKSRPEALAELNRLGVQAANSDGNEVLPVNTRLTLAQVRLAEVAFERLGAHSLPDAVEWFLANYRPPSVEMVLEKAITAFNADRAGNVSLAVVKDYRMIFGMLAKAFPGRLVSSITSEELEALMRTRGRAKKSWNNLRCYIAAFFSFCAHDARRWVLKKPTDPIRKHTIARGLPTILTAAQVRELFAFLENYSGPARCGYKAGYLVLYFALATFAGIRPGVINGEMRELADLEDKSRAIDLALGVIRLTPEMTKTNSLRQITIQPNLAAWLKRYPVKDFPVMVDNMAEQVSRVRKLFALGNDVLRHTFVSMHAARFKSLGGTALEAGNSEAIIKKHYFNLVTAADAEVFWSIVPKAVV